jgi:hypothetical protein
VPPGKNNDKRLFGIGDCRMNETPNAIN